MLSSGAPNETTFGPILRKEIGPTIHETINLFVEKDIGGSSSGRPVFTYAVETRLALGTIIEPGIQVYGTPGEFGHFSPISQQDHRAGPQLLKRPKFILSAPERWKWNGGVLFRTGPRRAPRNTLRWQKARITKSTSSPPLQFFGILFKPRRLDTRVGFNLTI